MNVTIMRLLSISLCRQVGSPETADLQIDFLHGYHGDGYPFDGAGGAVGHAFFPSDPTRAGGVHLDAEEEWTFRQPGGMMFRKRLISQGGCQALLCSVDLLAMKKWTLKLYQQILL